MRKPKVRILREQVEQKFLPSVRRPSRYIGGEINQVKKCLDDSEIRAALCFPDIYEIGMSHTGLAIIYHVLNQIEGVAAERVFAPWVDAEKILRDQQIPLFTLESMAAVRDFDIVGFSLTNELCLTNVLNILDLAQISIRSSKRSEDEPLVIAGGQVSNYAEPIADFVDIFLLGEGEEAVVRLIELISEQKKAKATRRQILFEVAKKFGFAYVPSLYAVEYDGEKIKAFRAKLPDIPTSFQNAVVDDLDGATVPLTPIVPFAQAVHERITVEVMRGCPGRCRFCQASFSRRPIRYRSTKRIIEIAKENYLSTGFDTVSLLSLSTADYPELEKLVVQLKEYFEPRHVGISLPSLRAKEQLHLLPKLITSVRKSGLTIAVEAASEKLRKVINKPISNEDLFEGVGAAYKAGFQRVKLYFMVGFPGETQEDIEEIVNLSYKIARLRKQIDNKTANVNIAISWFVPKPHTPFSWLGQKDKEYFELTRKVILEKRRELRARFLQFKFHDIQRSVLESAIGRADRRMADVIETAWRSGAKFDLWDECFNYHLWAEAFQKHRINPDTAAQKCFGKDDILPWEHLGGPNKKYLLDHLNDAMNEAKEI